MLKYVQLAHPYGRLLHFQEHKYRLLHRDCQLAIKMWWAFSLPGKILLNQGSQMPGRAPVSTEHSLVVFFTLSALLYSNFYKLLSQTPNIMSGQSFGPQPTLIEVTVLKILWSRAESVEGCDANRVVMVQRCMSGSASWSENCKRLACTLSLPETDITLPMLSACQPAMQFERLLWEPAQRGQKSLAGNHPAACRHAFFSAKFKIPF